MTNMPIPGAGAREVLTEALVQRSSPSVRTSDEDLQLCAGCVRTSQVARPLGRPRQPSQVMLSRSEGGNACYLVLRRVSEQDSAHHRRSPALFLCFNQMAGEVCHVVRNEKRELCVCGARRFSSSSPCVVSVISRFVSVPTNWVSFFWRPSRRSSLLPAPWTLRGGYLFHHLSASVGR